MKRGKIKSTGKTALILTKKAYVCANPNCNAVRRQIAIREFSFGDNNTTTIVQCPKCGYKWWIYN